jgi:hypothetical protein
MTADDALALVDAAAGWVETLTGCPLEPAERAWIDARVAAFVAPRLDESARMRIWVSGLKRDLETGRAIVVRGDDDVVDVWRGES